MARQEKIDGYAGSVYTLGIRLGGPAFAPVRQDVVPARPSFFMHLLYLDDAGSVANPDDQHFILAGISIFERQAHWLQVELDNLAAKLASRLNNSTPGTLEFHRNPIRKGDGWWRKMKPDDRRSVITDALLTARALRGQWGLFGVVVDKAALAPNDPIEYAFEQICYRFDIFLQRLHHAGNTQRGLIILDKSSQETRLQSLATEFRTYGNSWGVTRNLVDVPPFRRLHGNAPYPIRRLGFICDVEEIRAQ